MKRCACCMRVTRENLSACKAFVDFWDDHVIIPSVRVFYRHPSLQKKPLMVMCLMSDDFNVFKIHMMMMLVNMARKFGVMVEHQNSLFVLRNPRLQRSFGLAIVYKIALTAIDSQYTIPDEGRSVSSCCLGLGKRLLMVLCGWKETRKLCCFSTRPILSETPLTYGSTT